MILRRRAILSMLCILYVPRIAKAQKSSRRRRIGYLCPYGSQKDGFVPFRDGLAELGYLAGRNIEIEASACTLSGSRDDLERTARISAPAPSE